MCTFHPCEIGGYSQPPLPAHHARGSSGCLGEAAGRAEGGPAWKCCKDSSGIFQLNTPISSPVAVQVGFVPADRHWCIEQGTQGTRLFLLCCCCCCCYRLQQQQQRCTSLGRRIALVCSLLLTLWDQITTPRCKGLIYAGDQEHRRRGADRSGSH